MTAAPLHIDAYCVCLWYIFRLRLHNKFTVKVRTTLATNKVIQHKFYFRSQLHRSICCFIIKPLKVCVVRNVVNRATRTILRTFVMKNER